ncbi:MAG: hypothetical protein ACKV1O_25795 [Saprospiraceae bacterium]
MRKFNSTSLLIFCCFTANAQLTYDRTDFERINGAYSNLTSLQTTVDYVYYPNHYSKNPGETLQAVLSVQGDSYRYRLADMETLVSPAKTLLIDHEEKKIMLDVGHQSLKQILFGADLDKLLSVCSRIQFSYPEQGVKKYELYADLAETERIDLYFDTSNFMMRRVVLYYKEPMMPEYGGTGEKPRLELVYRRQNTTPQFAANQFSIERFVHKVGDRYVAAAAYRNYQILDATSNR